MAGLGRVRWGALGACAGPAVSYWALELVRLTIQTPLSLKAVGASAMSAAEQDDEMVRHTRACNGRKL